MQRKWELVRGEEEGTPVSTRFFKKKWLNEVRLYCRQLPRCWCTLDFREVSPARLFERRGGCLCVTSNSLPFSGPLLVSRVTAQSIQTNFAKFPRDGCSNNSSNRGSLIDILILNDAAVPALWEA